MNIHQTKKEKKYSNSNENMLFWRKTDETICNLPPFSKRTPPFSTNSPISEQFFHDPPLYPNFKNKKPSLILGGGGEKLWKPTHLSFYYIDFTYRHSVIWDNSIFLEADSSSFSVIRMICSNMIIIIPMLPCEGYCHHQMMVESKKCQTQMSYL